MKIRTQSFILVTGIVAMPVLVILLFVVVERSTFAAQEASRYQELELHGATMSADETVRYIFARKPAHLGMAIVDAQGFVVCSDIGGMPVGSKLVDSLRSASRSLDRSEVLAFGVAPPMPAGYLAFASIPRADLLPKHLREDIIKAGILVIAAMLSFTAAMCVLIVRSITKSVLSLEAATKRVAAGELDIPIAVEGSNEIASLSRSLDRLRIEVKEDQARQARFIMGISHDLKTPLALVKGYAEALEEELGGARASASTYLGIIQSKADQLEGMIDNLIDFERVDTGEWSRGLAVVDLGAFLRLFAKRVQADALLLGHELRATIDLPPGARVRMDERLVTRALENLVNNALRYTPVGGAIGVSARAEGDAYLLVVADEGPGIPSEDIPHIFEPFYRGSSSRREQGMGLGLSIVKSVVESHGWKIEVMPGRDEDGASKGIAFVLSLPPAIFAEA